MNWIRLKQIMIIMNTKMYTCYYVPGTFLSVLHISPDAVLKQPYEIGTVISPISQMRKLGTTQGPTGHRIGIRTVSFWLS